MGEKQAVEKLNECLKEMETTRQSIGSHESAINHSTDAIKGLKLRLEDLEKDAERYREGVKKHIG